MEMKDSPKPKASKLKTGASFRFLKKQKKVRQISDRPVIEHWDKSRQERLQSTLEDDEKELYEMQRSNTGSLFPNFFYSAKAAGQSGTTEEKTKKNGDAAGELGPTSQEPQRGGLLSQSYPEKELRNLARISESDPQESVVDYGNPSGTISAPTMIASDEKGTVKYTSANDLFENESNGHRSYSENNLSQHAFQDEQVARTTQSFGRPPSVLTEDQKNFETTDLDDDMLTLKMDSTRKKSEDPFNGDELATFMTVPPAGLNNRVGGKSTELEKVNGSRGDLDEKRLKGVGEDITGRLVASPPKSAGNSLTCNDEYFTTLGFPEEQKQREAKIKQEAEKAQILKTPHEQQPGYQNDNKIPKLNNNFKQVSEILTNGDKKNSEATLEDSTNPVRPPRKKDKLRRLSEAEHHQNEKNIFDFDSTKTSSNDKNKNDREGLDKNTTSKSWMAKKDMIPRSDYKSNDIYSQLRSKSSNSLNDYHIQTDNGKNRSNTNYERRKFNSAVNLRSGMNQDQEHTSYTRRKSDGFAMNRARSDDHLYDEYSGINTRRKSEGFSRSVRDRTSREEFLKPNTEQVRRKSDGFSLEGFTRQNEVSLDHPRQRSDDISARHMSGDFTRQKEVSLDHPRQRSDDFTNQRRSDSFTNQKEVSLDHFRRRTIHNPPSLVNQSDSRHVLPSDIPLDNTRRRASSGKLRNDTSSVSKSPDIQVERRVPPPYRPPPSLEHSGASQDRRPPTRPNYMPPPPPSFKDEHLQQPSLGAPPYRGSQEFNSFTPEYSDYNPGSRQNHPSPRGLPLDAESATVRQNQPSYYSTDISRSGSQPNYPPPMDSPIAPPRKYRESSSRSSDDPDYPPSEISPTAPPRRHRGSVHRHPSRPPPSVPSNPPPTKSLEDDDYTQSRELPLDRSKRSGNNDPNDIAVIVASSYPSDYNDQLHYVQSDTNQYYPREQSSYYGQSDRSPYHPSGQANHDEHFSNNRQSEANEFYPAVSTSCHEQEQSSFHYPTESSRQFLSEFSPKYEPIATGNLPGSEDSSLRNRPAVGTTTRYQSPPDEVVLATSITSEPEPYAGEFRSERREAADYVSVRQLPENGGYDENSENRSFIQGIRHHNEFDSNAVSKYDGYIETGRSEQEIEPGIIVAREMPSREQLTEARPLKREDVNAPRGEEMKNKWTSSSSGGSNESLVEKRNKYRMTSMI